MTGAGIVSYPQEEFAIPHLCARVGALLTVAVRPAHGGGPLVDPRSSDPGRAAVVSALIDKDGTARATLRATHPGPVTVRWGSGNTTTFTVRLDIVADQAP